MERKRDWLYIVGVDCNEGPPVPIPNTEVKLVRADNTLRVTAREDRSMLTHSVGVFNAEGPPVPIPNTEVKLCSADNTRLETARKDRSMPTPVKGNSDVSLDSHLNMPT